MFKWVLSLCVSLYAILILFGGEGYDASKYAVIEAEPEVKTVVEKVEVTRAAAVETPVLETAAIEAVEASENPQALIAAVETAALDDKANEIVAASTEVDDTTRPTLVLQPATTSVAASSAIVAEPQVTDPNSPVGQIWTVTANRVNLRAGASTRNAVVGSAVLGNSAEIVEMLDNGWAKVYIIESGQEAYMSAKFIAPQQG